VAGVAPPHTKPSKIKGIFLKNSFFDGGFFPSQQRLSKRTLRFSSAGQETMQQREVTLSELCVYKSIFQPNLLLAPFALFTAGLNLLRVSRTKASNFALIKLPSNQIHS
jgi:hypothetical protein